MHLRDSEIIYQRKYYCYLTSNSQQHGLGEQILFRQGRQKLQFLSRNCETHRSHLQECTQEKRPVFMAEYCIHFLTSCMNEFLVIQAQVDADKF